MAPHHTVGGYTIRIGEELQDPAIHIGCPFVIGKATSANIYLVDTPFPDDILPELFVDSSI